MKTHDLAKGIIIKKCKEVEMDTRKTSIEIVSISNKKGLEKDFG